MTGRKVISGLAAGLWLTACAPPPPVELSAFGCPPPFNLPRPGPADEEPRLAFPQSMQGCATRANLAAMLANPGDMNGRDRYPLTEGNRAIDPVARIKRHAPPTGGPISIAPPATMPPAATGATPPAQ